MATTALVTHVGERTQQIRIEKPTQTADGEGGKTITGYTLRAVVWAAEEPLSNREALQAQQLTGVLQTAWTIPFRWDAATHAIDLSITDRILVGRRVLRVTAYHDPTQRRAELRVLCSEIQT